MIWLGRANDPYSIPLTTLRTGVPAGSSAASASSVARRYEVGMAATIKSASARREPHADVIRTASGRTIPGRWRSLIRVRSELGGMLAVARPEPNVADFPAEKHGEGRAHAPRTQDRHPIHRPTTGNTLICSNRSPGTRSRPLVPWPRLLSRRNR